MIKVVKELLFCFFFVWPGSRLEGQDVGEAACRSSKKSNMALPNVAADFRGLEWFLAKEEDWQRDLVREPWRFPVVAMHMAAMRIQRFLKERLGKNGDRTEGAAKGTGVAKASNAGKVREELRNRYLVLMQKQLESRFGGANAQASGGQKRSTYGSFEHFCAALIQSYWRAKVRDYVNIVKRVMFLRKHVLYLVAAHEIQFHWRSYFRWRVEEQRKEQRLASAEADVATDLRDGAARKLQKAWRGCNDYKMYVALKEIIAFQPKGDPFLLLRSIAPREAQLLDPATQAHLRFRLGGTSFPPSIYFKIFTHGALVDIGAFAPRNYVAERTYGVEFPQERYARAENNGWRPLAVRLYRRTDEVEKATSRKRQAHFHHSRAVRKADLERRRREKKSEWIKKLFQLPLPELTPRDGAQTAREHPGQEALRRLGGGQDGQAPFEAPPLSTRSAPPGAPLQPGDAMISARSTVVTQREGIEEQRRGPIINVVHTTPDPSRGSPGMELEDGGELFDEAGMMGALGQDLGHIPENAAMTMDQQAPGGAVTWGLKTSELMMDDDALLQWSEQLDFDAYLNTWQRVATSANSEGELPIGWEFVHEV